MYSVQNWTLLSNNLYVFGRKTFNIDLNYLLKQFLKFLKHSVKSQTATLTSKRNTVRHGYMPPLFKTKQK